MRKCSIVFTLVLLQLGMLQISSPVELVAAGAAAVHGYKRNYLRDWMEGYAKIFRDPGDEVQGSKIKPFLKNADKNTIYSILGCRYSDLDSQTFKKVQVTNLIRTLVFARGDSKFRKFVRNSVLNQLWLDNLTFEGFTFRNIDFNGCKFFNTKFINCKFRDCNFNLYGAAYRAGKGVMSWVRKKVGREESFPDMSRLCNFSGATFTGSTFEKCSYSGAYFGENAQPPESIPQDKLSAFALKRAWGNDRESEARQPSAPRHRASSAGSDPQRGNSQSGTGDNGNNGEFLGVG